MINSRGAEKPERKEPGKLDGNAGMSSVGSCVLGMGFVLTPEEREKLIAKDPKNAQRIFPYIGGKEINTSPAQDFRRYVIDFGAMALEEAEQWPGLLAIVREKVKPARDKAKNHGPGLHGKKYWWQHTLRADPLYTAIRDLPRCLVNSRVSKHLMFSFQPTDRVFAESLYVFPLPAATHFAILQSRVHEPWARLLSSSLEDRLRYVASDCFDTFPFPEPDPRTPMPALETIGERLYETRAAYMTDTDQGLTKTHNALTDPTNQDPAILHLRALHEEMDRAVLRAYGWDDIPVPSFVDPCPGFREEVCDRLLQLNLERSRP